MFRAVCPGRSNSLPAAIAQKSTEVVQNGVTNVTVDFDDLPAALEAFGGAAYFDNPAHVAPCP